MVSELIVSELVDPLLAHEPGWITSYAIIPKDRMVPTHTPKLLPSPLPMQLQPMESGELSGTNE